MPSLWSSLVLLAAASLAHADTIITYPGWRGNNLKISGTSPEDDPNAEAVTYARNGSEFFPYGMQFAYPCGGMPLSHNRTKWPVTGGAVAVQPGWGNGHQKAQFFMNIGVEEQGEIGQPNITYNVVPPFQVTGPSNGQYQGQFCLPNVPLPAGLTFKEGDNITLQVIELTEYGAALYNCVDLTLASPNDPELNPANPSNCFNNSDFGFGLMFSTTALAASAADSVTPSTTLTIAAIAIVSVFALF